MSLLPEECLVSRSGAWSKLEAGWILVASLVLSATACFYADWFYYVATLSFVLHFILLGRGNTLGFLFGGVAVCFYGFYCARLGMAFHLWAQGLYLVINLMGAAIWQYQYAFRKPQLTQDLPYWHDTLLTLVLVFGTGVVAYNLITSGDYQESLRPFTILGAAVGMMMVIFEFRERWWVLIQVCSVAAVLWLMHFVQTGYGIQGMVAWIVCLISVVICHYSSRT